MGVALSEGDYEVTVRIPDSGWNPDTRMVTITPGKNDLSVTLLPILTQGPPGPQGPPADISQTYSQDVDCEGVGSVNDALAEAAGWPGPVHITVKGVCTEAVRIDRDRVTLQGASVGAGLSAPSPNSIPLEIGGARDTRLRNLTITGGINGLVIEGRSQVDAEGLAVTGNSSAGVTVSESNVELRNSHLIGNPGLGVDVRRGGYLRLQNSQVSDNGGFGVLATASHIVIEDTVVDGNGSQGVSGFSGATFEILGSALTNNHHTGLSLLMSSADVELSTISGNALSGVDLSGSSLSLGDFTVIEYNLDGSGVDMKLGSRLLLIGATIYRNGGDGISVGDVSVVDAGYWGEENHVTYNEAYGIACAGPPAVAQIARGALIHYEGNVKGDTNCPEYPEN